MDLVSNGVVITDAIKDVNGKMDHLNKQEKKCFRISKITKGRNVKCY